MPGGAKKGKIRHMSEEKRKLTRKERRAMARVQSKQATGVNVVRVKKWALVLGVFLLILVLTALAIRQSRRPDQPLTMLEPAPVTENDHYLGAQDASATLIKYSDFEAPGGAGYNFLLTEVLDHFEDDELKFVYRHFPLDYHDGAEPTARAAEAAGYQGEFWSIHEMIFQGQEEWSGMEPEELETVLFEYAEALELDQEQFEADFDRPDVGRKIEENLADGRRIGVSEVPAFFLNGEMIENPDSAEKFIDLIEEELD